MPAFSAFAILQARVNILESQFYHAVHRKLASLQDPHPFDFIGVDRASLYLLVGEQGSMSFEVSGPNAEILQLYTTIPL